MSAHSSSARRRAIRGFIARSARRDRASGSVTSSHSSPLGPVVATLPPFDGSLEDEKHVSSLLLNLNTPEGDRCPSFLRSRWYGAVLPAASLGAGSLAYAYSIHGRCVDISRARPTLSCRRP